MKIIYKLVMAVVCTLALVSCEDEKQHIFFDGNLPIKTTTLYMLGDATPNGWDNGNPTPLEALGEDPLIFEWEGTLHKGEMKLCLVGGSWDVPFIRPKVGGTEIGTEPIVDAEFKMNAGDPDDKWKIVEEGVYHLSFNLRNWTMSTTYLRGADPIEIVPVEAEEVFMVGNATSAGWDIENPVMMVKESQYIFKYEGELMPGELKMCTSSGSWDVPFIRPTEENVAINADGVASEDFIYTNSPDYKWKIEVDGMYVVRLDLEHWKISVTCNEVIVVEKHPIETNEVYMIGSATDTEWSMDDAQEYVQDSNNPFIFTWTGHLKEGTFKACTVRDNSYSCPFIRPLEDGVEVNANGVAAADFTYTTGPDDQWKVTEEGVYTITLDLENWTIAVTQESAVEPNAPIETETLYIIGDATEGGWDLGAATAFAKSETNPYLFTAETNLKEGEFKAVVQLSFSGKHIRPAAEGVTVNAAGVSSPEFVFTADPDTKWSVTEAAKYELTFDLENYTIAVRKTGEYEEPETPPTPPTPGLEPIEANTLYIIGDATPGGWSMGLLTELTQSGKNPYIFTWRGPLHEGELKACVAADESWGCPFIRPSSEGVTISKSGVSATDFIYTKEDSEHPDYKWKVTFEGVYDLTFDLENYTISAIWVSAIENNDPDPLETETLLMIGDATANGWDLGGMTAMTKSTTDPFVFTYEGSLKVGELKMCTHNGGWDIPFVRPAKANVTIDQNGVSDPKVTYSNSPDNKWNIKKAGTYRLTVNLKEWTISAEFVN